MRLPYRNVRLAAVLLSPMLLSAHAVATVVVLTTPNQASSTTLHVSPSGSDSNLGGQAAPFATILKASRVATPGTTVRVAPGTYAGGFQTTASGTASSPIAYVSDTPFGAKIVPPASSSSDTAWENRGAYVTISGFEIDGSHVQAGRPWVMGIVTFGSNSTIANNYVHDIALNVTPSSYGGGGIEGDSYYGGSNFTVVDNIVANIGPGNDSFIQGIYLSGPGTVANNVVHDVSGYGIHLWHNATNVIIANNTVYHNRTGGILVGGGDFHNGWTGPNDHTVVANNVVVGNPRGIFEHGATGMHNVYTNDLVYRNAVNWLLLNGLTRTKTVTADPLFVNPEAGDFNLRARSPAIDRGTSAYAPARDIAGIARPQGTAPDIGAYEYVGSGPHRSGN